MHALLLQIKSVHREMDRQRDRQADRQRLHSDVELVNALGFTDN